MHEHDLILCHRIREKCQQQHWYGGDASYADDIRERMYQSRRSIGTQGKHRNDPDDHPRKMSFACAPATEEQLLATEQELGFPFPPFLRLLYSSIANGGFGPGYGLIGAKGGFDEAGTIVEMYQYHTTRAQLVDLEQYERAIWPDSLLELPETVWPRFMLYLCDWGEANVSCLDCVTGHVLLVRMGEKYRRYVLEMQASSSQAWWEQWLAEKPPEEKQMSHNPLFLDDDFDPFAGLP